HTVEPTAIVEPVDPEPAAEEGSAESSVAAEPTPYVPRSQAPERTSNLAAMRELANNSARSAIAQSVRKRMIHEQISKFALAVFSVGAGVATWFGSGFALDQWFLVAC